MNAEAEFRRFARYLIGGPSSAPLAQRYAEACGILGLARHDAMTRAAARTPWLLGPLDAGAALVAPRCLLRRRLLLAAAILETSPRHARQFLPQDLPPLRFAGRLLQGGVVAAMQAALGAPLVLLLGPRE
jgi:hypothetical protein